MADTDRVAILAPLPVTDSSLLDFQGRIGHTFLEPLHLLRALTHKSYAHESRDSDVPDNETLEFLGDSVLGFIVGERLFEQFPEMDEGALSKMKAFLVSAPSLARKARAYRLGEVLRVGVGEERSGGRNKDSLLADAFEAVIAAVYLDSGLEAARRLVLGTFGRDISDIDHTDLLFHDFKTALQEVAQSRGIALPEYTVMEERGPDHSKTFVVEVRVGAVTARGEGTSKKEAQQRAAREALDMQNGAHDESRGSV